MEASGRQVPEYGCHEAPKGTRPRQIADRSHTYPDGALVSFLGGPITTNKHLRTNYTATANEGVTTRASSLVTSIFSSHGNLASDLAPIETISSDLSGVAGRRVYEALKTCVVTCRAKFEALHTRPHNLP
jgi:hypothetical protein